MSHINKNFSRYFIFLADPKRSRLSFKFGWYKFLCLFFMDDGSFRTFVYSSFRHKKAATEPWGMYVLRWFPNCSSTSSY